jgi:hypothetical protein
MHELSGQLIASELMTCMYYDRVRSIPYHSPLASVRPGCTSPMMQNNRMSVSKQNNEAMHYNRLNFYSSFTAVGHRHGGDQPLIGRHGLALGQSHARGKGIPEEPFGAGDSDDDDEDAGSLSGSDLAREDRLSSDGAAGFGESHDECCISAAAVLHVA